MPHWKSINIQSFRRLENLRLEDLGTVNLLVGKNNSGKTSVLEAIAIASDPLNAWNWIDIGRERELKSARTPLLEVLSWFFPHQSQAGDDFKGTVSIKGQVTSGGVIKIDAEYQESRDLRMSLADDNVDYNSSSSSSYEDQETVEDDAPEYTATLSVKNSRLDESGQVLDAKSDSYEFRGTRYKGLRSDGANFPCQFVSPVSHRTNRQLLAAVTQVIADRRKAEVITLLQQLAPDVDDLEILSPQGRGSVVHIHHSGVGYVPLAMEGDGMRRALAFASAATLAKNGVLLIDEIETALHPDALATNFRFLVRMCREVGVQLFVTTHSLEAIDAILLSVGDEIDDLVAFHLPPRNSSQTVYRLGGKSIHSMRYGSGLDIR